MIEVQYYLIIIIQYNYYHGLVEMYVFKLL